MILTVLSEFLRNAHRQHPLIWKCSSHFLWNWSAFTSLPYSFPWLDPLGQSLIDAAKTHVVFLMFENKLYDIHEPRMAKQFQEDEHGLSESSWRWHVRLTLHLGAPALHTDISSIPNPAFYTSTGSRVETSTLAHLLLIAVKTVPH